MVGTPGWDVVYDDDGLARQPDVSPTDDNAKNTQQH